MKSIPYVCLILFRFFATPVPSWAQEDAEPAVVSGFADWLYGQGEFVRAAGEYYRELFHAAPDDRDVLLFTIGTCYLKAAEYRQALLVFEKLIDEHPQSQHLEDAYYQAAYCSYKLEEYDALTAQIDRLTVNGPLPPRFLLLQGAGNLLAGRWDNARPLLSAYLAQPGLSKQVAALLTLADEAAHPDGRSGLAAGIFSALVPGTGKIYAGRWEDGITSFLLCGFLGGLAAYHFIIEGTDSAPAWIYTALGGVFYLGNIYGSVVAADRYNAVRQADYLQKVQAGVRVILP